MKESFPMTSATNTTGTNYDSLYNIEFQVPYGLKAIHLVNQEQMSINLAELIAGFQIYESIHSKFVTGEIVFVDGINVPRLYRLTGQEFVRISFNDGDDESNTYDLTFRAYKMCDQKRGHNGIMQGYKLLLCDPTMYKAQNRRISQVFSGSYSNMLKNVMTSNLDLSEENDLGVWEDTESENCQFICPNWTPQKLMGYFTQEADLSLNPAWRHGMFLYQTFDGKFNFKSIDLMCNTNPDDIPQFIYKPTSGGLDAVDIEKKHILEVQRPLVFDTLKGTILGLYASSSLTYDSIRKVLKENVYNVEETLSRTNNHISGNPLLRTETSLNGNELGLTTKDSTSAKKSPATEVVDKWTDIPPNLQKDSFVVYNYNNPHSNDNSSDVNSSEAFVNGKITNNSNLERRALMELLKQDMISIIVPVRTDVNVGEVIDLKIPEPELQDESSETKDKINDNRYLIVNSVITINNGRQQGSLHLECVKESFAKQISQEELKNNIELSSKAFNVGDV